MTSLALTDTKGLMAQHVASVKEYARRVVLQGESLALYEEDDRAYRMQEFVAAGSSFRLTEKEMVLLIYRGLFEVKRGCDCPTCRSRESVRQGHAA